MEKAFFFIAGGKTGGHLFPGIAIAEELLRIKPTMRPCFIGVKHGLEAKVIPAKKYAVRFLPVQGLYGQVWWKKIYRLSLLPVSVFIAAYWLLRLRPKFVLGVGGYASFPTVLAAAILRFPTFIQEQNSVLGKANRFLLPFVDKVFIPDLPQTILKTAQKNKFILCANPVRQSIHQLSLAQPNQTEFLRSEVFTILVIGGSQGASFVNRVVVQAVSILQQQGGRYSMIHQTGKQDYAWVKQTYKELGVKAQVQTFFEQMDQVYQQAHLLIARAGAGIFECNAAARAGIFIPIARSSEDHQKKNAQRMVEKGAGWMLEEKDCTADALAAKITEFFADSKIRAKMEQNSRSMYAGNSAQKAASEIVKYIYPALCLFSLFFDKFLIH